MPKHEIVYLFEDLIKRESQVLESMTQLEGLTGMGYRTIQRRFSEGDVYYSPKGLFRIEKKNVIKDDRKNNHNPKFN